MLQDESVEKGAHDGVWNGIKYYDCKHNRGIFVPLINLKPHNEVKEKLSAGNHIATCVYIYM